MAAAAADAIEYIAAASIQVDPAFSVWSSLHFARRLLPLILLAASTSAAFSTLIEITATPQCLSFSFSFCCTLNSLFHSLRATSVDCVCVCVGLRFNSMAIEQRQPNTALGNVNEPSEE